MQISWNGLGSFTIQSKPVQADVTLVTDPYAASTGLKFPKTLTASLIVQSHEGPNASEKGLIAGEFDQKPFIVDHAGEYEIKGVFVQGINAPKKDGTDHVIFRFMTEGVTIGFLGALDRPLKEKEVEKLGSIDVLILPVGGGEVISKSTAAEIVAQIEPRLVIPSYYNVAGGKMELEDVSAFCKELGAPMEETAKLKVTASTLPQEDLQIAVISK